MIYSLLEELGFRISIVSGIPDSLNSVPNFKTQDSGIHKQKFHRLCPLFWYKPPVPIKLSLKGEQERIKLELYPLLLWIITCFYIKFMPWIPTWMYFTGTSSPTSLLLFPVTCAKSLFWEFATRKFFNKRFLYFCRKHLLKLKQFSFLLPTDS